MYMTMMFCMVRLFNSLFWKSMWNREFLVVYDRTWTKKHTCGFSHHRRWRKLPLYFPTCLFFKLEFVLWTGIRRWTASGKSSQTPPAYPSIRPKKVRIRGSFRRQATYGSIGQPPGRFWVANAWWHLGWHFGREGNVESERVMVLQDWWLHVVYRDT